MEGRYTHITQEIVDRLLASSTELKLEVRAIYVFGSFGTRHFKADSDIDLGVLASRPLTATDKLQLISALDQPDNHVVDLVDLNAVDLEMQDIVISERRRIYTHPDHLEEVEDYEDRVWVTYLTLCDDRKEIIDQIKRTGIIYGPDYIEKGRIRKPVH